jgi:hypothetical protein
LGVSIEELEEKWMNAHEEIENLQVCWCYLAPEGLAREFQQIIYQLS